MRVNWFFMKTVVLTRLKFIFDIWLTSIIVFLFDEGPRLWCTYLHLVAIYIWHLERITSTVIRLLANSLQLILHSIKCIIFFINDNLRILFLILIIVILILFIIFIILGICAAWLRLLCSLIIFLLTIILVLLFYETQSTKYTGLTRFLLFKHFVFIF